MQELEKFDNNNPKDIIRLLEYALDADFSITTLIENIERLVIKRAIARHGAKSAAYKHLRMPKSTFFMKKRKYLISKT